LTFLPVPDFRSDSVTVKSLQDRSGRLRRLQLLLSAMASVIPATVMVMVIPSVEVLLPHILIQS